MAYREQVLLLIERYQDMRAQGQTFVLEDVCHDCPHLLDEFKRAIRELESVNDMLGLTRKDEAGPLPVQGYEILDELGRGGMGVVYKARQLSLGRSVALKMILAGGHAGSAERARFRTEAEAVARLQHPGIVQIHEVGESDGKPFLVLEFVEGGSLADKLDGTPLPAREAAGLVEQLGRAVHYAHEQGIIHRDLKPANVLLTREQAEPGMRSQENSGTQAMADTAKERTGKSGSRGQEDPKVSRWFLAGSVRAKITDFGLAKKLDAGPGQTQSGAILGTPSYMAPEQASGAATGAGAKSPIGPAADVYALGAILYELVAGRPPFKAATTLETLQQVVAEEPVPPARLNSKLPRDLETICLKCLQKNQHRRYADAAALVEDLRRFQAGEPVLARPIGGLTRTLRWCRRRPAAASLLAALVLVAVVSVAGLWQWQEAALANYKADVAETDKSRQTLEAFHAQADAHLGRLRLLKQAVHQPNVRQEVFDLVRQVGLLRGRAEKTLTELGDQARTLAREEKRRWDERTAVLRQEATRWLMDIQVHRQRSIPLPEGLDPGLPQTRDGNRILPSVALRPDLKQVALVYPGDTTVFVLDANGREQRRLAFPKEFARAAVTVNIESRTMFGVTNTYRHPVTHPARLAYAGPNRLEYQIGEVALTWSLPEGKRGLEKRSQGLPPWWLATRYVSGEHYLASYNLGSTGVAIREWAPDAQPQALWQPRETAAKDKPEAALDLAFGGDGRALFIRTQSWLSLVDASGGTSTEESLREEGTNVELGTLIPCKDGVAVVERRRGAKRDGRPQLVFWSASLPQAGLGGLHHDDVPRCLDWAQGLLVVGGADHRVHAWRGRQSAWASGIPYLVAEKTNVPGGRIGRTRIPFADLHWQDRTWGEHIGDWHHRVQKGWRRTVAAPSAPTLEGYPTYIPPPPYPFWQFAQNGRQSLVVSRRELLPNGGSRLRAELYAAGTGRLEDAFPAEGNGRILVHSEDYRFAVVVTEEKNSRCTLEVWSIPQRRRLGSLGRYPISPQHLERAEGALTAHFTTSAGKNWLLFGRALPNRAGTELGIWRLPEVKSTGRMVVPASGWPVPTDRPGLVVLQSPNWRFPPVYGMIIDLEKARKVCDLEGFEGTGHQKNHIHTGARLVVAWRRGFDIDPYQVSVWELTTGRRRDLGSPHWMSGKSPTWLLNPAGDRLLICGNLHENGMAHVELWDLARAVLVNEVTLPTKGIPWAPAIQERYCALDFPDFSKEGHTKRLYWKWADGEETQEAPPTALRLVDGKVQVARSWQWLLWRDDSGLYVERVGVSKRVPLQDTAKLRPSAVIYPARGGRALVIEGEDGGVWDTYTGRRLVRFPAGHRFRCCDPTERWALTVGPERKELHLWDLKTGKKTCRRVPRDSTDPAFDPVAAPLQLHPGGKRLAVLSQGVLRLWDLEANRQVMALDRPGHFTPVRCVAQHAGADLVASADGAGVIHLWKRGDGAAVRALLAQTSAITALTFKPDGTGLVSATDGGDLALHDLRGRRRWQTRIPRPATTVTQLRFAGAGLLLAATGDGRALALEPKTGRVLRSQRVGRTALQALALSPDGRLLALGSEGGHVHLWDAALRKPRRRWNAYAPVPTLAFVGNELLATGGASVRFWELGKDETVWDVEVLGGARELVLNEATGQLAVANDGDRVLVFDLPELYRRLKTLQLGFAAFPRDRWPLAVRPAPSLPAPPRRWQDWCQWAERCLREGRRWEEAVWASSQAVALAPGEWRPWALRAEAYTRSSFKSQWESAVVDAAQALALKADDWRLWQRRAANLARLGRWREAAVDLDRAIALKAPGAGVRYERAEARSMLRQYDLTLADLDEALRLDPKHLEAAYLRGETLILRMGEMDKALAGLAKALADEPQSERAHLLRGMAYRLKKDYKAALADINKALDLNPDYAAAYLERGRAYILTGKLDKAAEDFNDAIVLNPTNGEAYRLRGIVHQERGDLPRAVADFSMAIRLDPTWAAAHLLRGSAYLRQHAFNQAIADFTTLISLEPNKAVNHAARGQAFFDKGDYRRVIDDLTISLRLDPDMAEVWNTRGVAHDRLGETNRALADLTEATKRNPRLALPYHNRGWVYRARREFDRALVEYTKAITLRPEYLPSWEARGHTHAERGDWDKAAADFAKVAEKSRTPLMAAYYRALALLGKDDRAGYSSACAGLYKRFGKSGDPGTASLVAWTAVLVPDAVEDGQPYWQLAEKAVAANPARYASLYTLGAAHFRAGRFNDAEKKLVEANQLFGKGGTAYDCFLLAMTAAQLGKPGKAGTWLQQGIKRFDQTYKDKPDKTDARTLLPWEVRLQLQLLRREAETLVARSKKEKTK